VIYFDHWWNPAIVDQASARVHRIGQQKAVFIHSPYTRHTIEERIDTILSGKRRIFQDVFGELEDKEALARLSDEELFGLFELRPPQVTHPEAARRLARVEKAGSAFLKPRERGVDFGGD
jgi:hypothetical protein